MRIAVAMSGGVDSSVAAAVLKQEGHELIGIFMKNWSPETGQSLSDCPWMADQADAEAVCEHLDIPFRTFNFEREYKERVLDRFLAEYQAGRTPNPDILCNKEIKFGAFAVEAKRLGCEAMATGHYVLLNENGFLKRGTDPTKDQSYFLYALDADQLSFCRFPLGSLLKSEVRQMALKFGLPTASKKDSQGICFIGHLDLKRFLSEHLDGGLGNVFLLGAEAALLAQAVPTYFYTLGERVGRLIDNRLYAQATGNRNVPGLFVAAKKGKDLFVSSDADCPELYSETLELDYWQGAGPATYLSGSTLQTRYQQRERLPLLSLTLQHDGRVRLIVGKPFAHAAATGQSAVVYSQAGEVLGGGTIINTWRPNGD